MISIFTEFSTFHYSSFLICINIRHIKSVNSVCVTVCVCLRASTALPRSGSTQQRFFPPLGYKIKPGGNLARSR